MPTADDRSTDRASSKDTTHEQALERFKLSSEAFDQQRKRESQALKVASGDQWPDDARLLRTGQTIGGVTLPGRPMVTVNALRQPLLQLENQQRAARLAINVSPKSGGSKKTAEVRQGLYRNIEVESRADIARGWAYKRAMRCGRGFYRIRTDYANDGDFDQDIIIDRILNQASVHPDPYAQQPDNSDAEWYLITEDLPFDTYKRKYGKGKGAKGKLESLNRDELIALGEKQPGWASSDGETDTVRIAEYWHCTYTKRKRVRTKGGWTGYEDDTERPSAEADPLDDGVVPREVEIRTVHCDIINAVEVIRSYEWPGRYIPIVQVVADEDNIDGDRSWEGIVGPAIGAQQILNYELSNLVETLAVAPRSPWVMAEGQNEGYEQMWQQANIRNFPALIYKPKTISGQLAPPPQRDFGEPPIQAITVALQQSEHFLNMTTGYFGPSRGQLTSERSGKAIQALQRQTETGNSGYLDQLATVSMTYEAKVVLDLMTYIYDRPGRVARILGVNDEPSAVMLNKPFVKDRTGQPLPVEDGQLPPGVPPETQPEHYDLTADEEYSVTVSVGKSYTTLREEAAETIGNLIQAEPQLLTLIGDIWVKNQDFPGADDIAERLQKMLPPPLQPQQEGGPPPIPPQVQQQMQAMSQQMQQLQQMADQNRMKMQQAQLEAESRERIEAAKLAMQKELEQIKQSAAVTIAQVKAQMEGYTATAAAQRDVDRTRAELTSDHALADRQHVHRLIEQAAAPIPTNGGAE